MKGGFDSRKYIELMDWVAEKAGQMLDETGKITVVVQDNGPMHKSKITQAQWDRWAEKGLVVCGVSQPSP